MKNYKKIKNDEEDIYSNQNKTIIKNFEHKKNK